MVKNKSQPSKASVAAFLNAIDGDDRRRDCKAIAKLLTGVSVKAGWKDVQKRYTQ